MTDYEQAMLYVMQAILDGLDEFAEEMRSETVHELDGQEWGARRHQRTNKRPL